MPAPKLKHLYVWLSAVGTVVLFLLGLIFGRLGSPPPVMLFVMAAFAVGIGTSLIHAAIWSVLGPREYVRQTVGAGALSIILLAGAFCGSFVGTLNETHGSSTTNFLKIMIYFLPMFVAAQIPIWFMRLVFGWQLVADGQMRMPLSISQLFFVTLLFAIAFTTPAVLAHIELQILQSTVLSEEELWANPLTEDDEWITSMREFAWHSIGTAALSAGIVSLLAVPVVSVVFRYRPDTAVVVLGLYGLALFAITALILEKLLGYDFILEFEALIVLLSIASSLVLLSVPLYNSKACGILLVTRKTVSEKNEPGQPTNTHAQ